MLAASVHVTASPRRIGLGLRSWDSLSPWQTRASGRRQTDGSWTSPTFATKLRVGLHPVDDFGPDLTCPARSNALPPFPR